MAEHDLELDLYFDGEMSTQELSAFEERLEGDAGLHAEHAMLSHTRDILRSDVRRSVDSANFQDFFTGVQSRLGEMPVRSPSVEPARVEPASTGDLSLGERLVAWWRAYWTPVMVSAVAAAVVAFAVTRGVVPAEDPLSAGPVVVERVDNAGSQTVLISMPAEGEGSTIIWLLEEEEEPEVGDSHLGEDPI